MSDLSFHDAYLAARQRIASGADPDAVVPGLLAVAEASEEIRLAEGLYGGLEEGDDGDG
jgi:2-methylcitrate dehydratase PrpD